MHYSSSYVGTDARTGQLKATQVAEEVVCCGNSLPLDFALASEVIVQRCECYAQLCTFASAGTLLTLCLHFTYMLISSSSYSGKDTRYVCFVCQIYFSFSSITVKNAIPLACTRERMSCSGIATFSAACFRLE